MNDFLLYDSLKFTIPFLVCIISIAILLKQKKGKCFFAFTLCGGVFIAALITGYVLFDIKRLEDGFTSIDKYSIENFDSLDPEYIEKMTDFTRNVYMTGYRYISLIVGENLAVSIPGEINEEPDILLMPEKIEITLEEAINILREEEKYVITDVKFTFEEHVHQPSYTFHVRGNKDLILIDINAITGEKYICRG